MAKTYDYLEPNGLIVQSLRQSFPYCLAIYAFGSRFQETERADRDLAFVIHVSPKNQIILFVFSGFNFYTQKY